MGSLKLPSLLSNPPACFSQQKATQKTLNIDLSNSGISDEDSGLDLSDEDDDNDSFNMTTGKGGKFKSNASTWMPEE